MTDFEEVGKTIRKHFGDPLPREKMTPEERKEHDRQERIAWFGGDYHPGDYHPFMTSTGMEGRCEICGLAESVLHGRPPASQ